MSTYVINRVNKRYGIGDSPTEGILVPGSIFRLGGTGNVTRSYSGSNEVLTFKSNGNLIVSGDGYIDFLLVGGGGSGGGYVGGGGGGGGVLYSQSVYIPAGTYSVIVGDGATGSFIGETRAMGGFSQFSNSIAYGGGFGGPGGASSGGASSGSSGGGGGSGSDLLGKSGSFGQGRKGGDSPGIGGNYPSAGGGGYSQTGSSPTAINSITGGLGGNGFQTSINGVLSWYGGGGGGSIAGTNGLGVVGGTGGLGGGGNAAIHDLTGKMRTSGTDGQSNTGGGGGGGTRTLLSGSGFGWMAGGSGVFIVNYLPL
jgi:hypothetical protein